MRVPPQQYRHCERHRAAERGGSAFDGCEDEAAEGKKIDFNSGMVKSYRAQLNNLRNDFKRWLRDNAPAKVTGEFDISLNAVAVQLNGTPLATPGTAPMVAGVQYQSVYAPQAHDDPDLALVHANEAWAGRQGREASGRVIDTGIDITHPCFSDGAPGNDGPFTNDRVVFGMSFTTRPTTRASRRPTRTVTGRTWQARLPATSTPRNSRRHHRRLRPVGRGPRGDARQLQRLPGRRGQCTVEDIVNALEKAYSEGFDVANEPRRRFVRSRRPALHGCRQPRPGEHGQRRCCRQRQALQHGWVAGQGSQGVERPVQSHCRALHRRHGHRQRRGRRLRRGCRTVRGRRLRLRATWTCSPARLRPARPCLPAASRTRSLIERGACAFSVKIWNAQTAGAVGVIMNNVPGPPIAMAQDAEPADHRGPSWSLRARE